MSVKITIVTGKTDQNQFIRLPWSIYRDDPNWVPPLIIDQKEMFDKRRFPFFGHSEADFFLAWRDGRPVGRIAAIRNNNHLKIYRDDVGFFGFFECINDPDVANALFNAAANWLHERGLKWMRGPESYSQNEEAGLLVDGFGSPPVLMMTYNPAYYSGLLETAGFNKIMDLYAYAISHADRVPALLAEKVTLIKKRAGFTVRPLNMRQIDREVEAIKTIYNAAWSENWGAVPLTDREMDHLVKNLVQIVIPDMALVAEIDAKPVGISITVPDINEALIKINGRLLPFGLLKLLWYRRRITGVRTLIMGVLKEYRKIGIDSVMYYETFKNGLAHGFTHGEMSWILENNHLMRYALENLEGCQIYKTYRLYQKAIGYPITHTPTRNVTPIIRPAPSFCVQYLSLDACRNGSVYLQRFTDHPVNRCNAKPTGLFSVAGHSFGSGADWVGMDFSTGAVAAPLASFLDFFHTADPADGAAL